MSSKRARSPLPGPSKKREEQASSSSSSVASIRVVHVHDASAVRSDKKSKRSGGKGERKGEGVPVPTTDTVPCGGPGFLPALLGPVSLQEFWRSHWLPKAPLVVRGSPSRYNELADNLLEGLDVQALLANTASQRVFVWVLAKGGHGAEAGTEAGPGVGVQTVALDDKEGAFTLYQAGHSTYCRAPEEAEATLVEATRSSLGLGLSLVQGQGGSETCEGEVELFISRPGHATGWHFDFQENLTLQLSGQKTWKLLPSSIKHPLRGCTPHYTPPNPAITEEQLKMHQLQDPGFKYGPEAEEEGSRKGYTEVTLGPGDMLFHPAGLYHHVTVEGQDTSISINISIHGMTWADLITSSLRQLMWREEGFRRLVDHHDPEEARGHLTRLLHTLSCTLTGTDPPPPHASLMSRMMLPDCLMVPREHKDDGDEDGEHEEEEEEEKEEVLEDGEDEAAADLTVVNIWEGEVDTTLDLDCSHPWKVNPLGHILPFDQVGMDVPPPPHHHHYYLLNFNFGGEELKSMVRVGLDVGPRPVGKHLLDSLIQATRGGQGQGQGLRVFDPQPFLASLNDSQDRRVAHRILSALVHYGILIY